MPSLKKAVSATLTSPRRPPRRSAAKPQTGHAQALKKIRLFLCDVDGILTDASVFMGGGVEYKRFHIRDGLGLRLLQRCGIKVGWVSNRPSDATTQRAEDLKIDFLHQSAGAKTGAIEEILSQTKMTWNDLCYMGDDIVDLGVLRRAGFAVTVPEALSEAREIAHYITHAPGGHGAVREVVDLILKAQGKWESLVRDYMA